MVIEDQNGLNHFKRNFNYFNFISDFLTDSRFPNEAAHKNKNQLVGLIEPSNCLCRELNKNRKLARNTILYFAEQYLRYYYFTLRSLLQNSNNNFM
jgi:hypothetical protein